MPMQSKWDVGDVVELKRYPHGQRIRATFDIREIRTITCSAGTQVMYWGRLWTHWQTTSGEPLESKMEKTFYEFHEDELVGIDKKADGVDLDKKGEGDERHTA